MYGSTQHADRSPRISPSRDSLERFACENRSTGLGDGGEGANFDPRTRAQSGYYARLREHEYGLLRITDKKRAAS